MSIILYLVILIVSCNMYVHADVRFIDSWTTYI